jgi:lipopolysaccharide transport system ATP-binding protein
MYVRLGFSVAAHMAPDVLLIDEVLAVGDLKFQRKCMEHAKQLLRGSAAVILVSHNMFSVKSLCQRAIYLSRGEVLYDGAVEEAVHRYEKDSQLTVAFWADRHIAEQGGQHAIVITSLETLTDEGKRQKAFDHGSRLRVRIRFRTSRPIHRPNFIVALIRSDNVACCNYNTVMDGVVIPHLDQTGTIELLTPPLKLTADTYQIQILVRDEDFQRLYCAQIGTSFQVRHELLSNHFGVFHEKAQWSLEPAAETIR